MMDKNNALDRDIDSAMVCLRVFFALLANQIPDTLR
jgi:hypothetical protein